MLRSSLFLFLFLPVISNAIYVNENIELFGAHKNDLDETYSALGMRSNWSNRYLNINGELIAEQTEDELRSRVNSFSATFLFPYYNNIDSRLTLGKVILPIGIHERQRLVPTSIGPRLSNDSFIFNQYSDFIPPASLGGIFELEKSGWSLDLGYYSPEPFEISASSFDVNEIPSRIIIIEDERIERIIIDDRDKTPETPDENPNSLIEFVLTDDGQLGGSVLEEIEGSIGKDGGEGSLDPDNPPNPPDAPGVEQDPEVTEEVELEFREIVIDEITETLLPTLNEVDLETKKYFIQISYDNSFDTIIDFEILRSETFFEEDETEKYLDHRYFIGYEKMSGPFVTSIQYTYNTVELQEDKYTQGEISTGVSVDFGKIVLHASSNTSNGDLHNLSDLNAGFSYIATDNLYSRINARIISGSYTRPEDLYATAIVFFDGCSECTGIKRTFEGNIEDRQLIKEVGLEFRLEFRF